MPESITSLSAFDLSVSADGARLAFASTDRRLYVANRDGTGVQPIAKVEAAVSDPNWSPDGTRVVFVAGNQIYIAVVATGAVTPLTPYMGRAWSPNFSPDGRTVLFTAATGRGWQWLSLWSVPANGGRAARLMKQAAMGTFSPDGTTIAFMEIALPGDGHVWVNGCVLLANADGTNRRSLVGSARNGRCQEGGGEHWSWTFERPDWSPDGRRIAFAESGDADGAVRVVRVATGTVKTIARGRKPTWSDDTTLIVESHRWVA